MDISLPIFFSFVQGKFISWIRCFPLNEGKVIQFSDSTRLWLVFPRKGQELWSFWTHQVHPPGGPGHHVIRLGLGSGERSEQQVLQAEGGRREGRVRPAHGEEEEDLRCEKRTSPESLETVQRACCIFFLDFMLWKENRLNPLL